MTIKIIKHTMLWIIFSFFYLSGLETAIKLAIDGQSNPAFLKTILLIFIFNLLVAYLIIKYEKEWPLVSSIVISFLGVFGFGIFYTSIMKVYSLELLSALSLSLPFATHLLTHALKFHLRDNE